MVPDARASPTARTFSELSCHFVNRRPSVTGMVLWKTIAPLMFPNARVSLASLTQIMELNFSGNSVARGARTGAIRPDDEQR